MNLVDSCGWLEYFADAPNADFFAPALQDTTQLLVPTVCLLEVFKILGRQRGEVTALRAVAQMRMGKVMDLDTSVALEAARLCRETQLPLADGVILATARLNGATVWTQDGDFKDMPDVKFQRKQ